jgi:hypothetical protein
MWQQPLEFTVLGITEGECLLKKPEMQIQKSVRAHMYAGGI